MMVAAREATAPEATASASSSCSGGSGGRRCLYGVAGRRQAEPAPGLGGADPQPRPQKLCGVPVAVIRRRGQGSRPGQVTAGARPRVSSAVRNSIGSAAGSGDRTAVGLLCPPREPARRRRFQHPSPGRPPGSRRTLCGSGPPPRRQRAGSIRPRGTGPRPGRRSPLPPAGRTGRHPHPPSGSKPAARPAPSPLPLRQNPRRSQSRPLRQRRRERKPSGEAGGHSRAGPRGRIRDELSNGFHN